MSPNTEQIQSTIRWLMTISGPLGAYLTLKGLSVEVLTNLVVAVIAVGGAIPPLLAFIWGWRAHTDAAKLRAVEKLKDVKEIVAVAKPDPKSAVAEALDSPAHEKVVIP